MTNLIKHKYINDILIHLAFAFWLLLSIVYYQERIYSDTGFYLSKVVHYESFWVELNRYILVFSEWLPLLLVKLGASMKVVMLGYSVGHVLFFYVCYLVARFYGGNKEAGWLLLLIQSVGILYGFCSPGFEFYYAAALLVVWATMIYRPFTIGHIGVQLLLLFLIITSHQLTAWLVGGALLVHLSEHKFKHWKYYLGIGFFVLACLLFKKITATNYEQEKMQWFLHLLWHHDFDGNYYYQLLAFYWQYYKELWLLIFISLAIYLQQKKYTTLAVYILFIIATQYIVSLSYTTIKHSRYQEQCYFPLIIVACYPLMMQTKLFLSQKKQQLLTFFLFGIIIYRFALIAVEIKPYKERLAFMQQLINACQLREGNKFIIEENTSPYFADLTFTFGLESMLISAINPRSKTVQIIRASDWEYLHSFDTNILADTTNYMFTYRGFYDRIDSVYSHESASKKYYNFPAGSYHFLRGDFAANSTKKDIKNQLKITAYPTQNYKLNQEYNILIKLENKGKVALAAKQIKIAYHWRDASGQIVEWEGIRTPLEIDLLAEEVYYQKIKIKMPNIAGKRYRCELAVIGTDTLGWIEKGIGFEIDLE